jgi:uncharacterized protein (DUF305 family)
MTTQHRTRTRAAALALGLATPFLLVACGSDDAASDISAGADFNAADVAFATDMIPHHAQALMMVDMADGRDLTPETAALMQEIEDAQGPEIELMTGWLEEWDQPVPDTSGMSMSGMEGMDHGSMDMSGMSEMMSAEDLDALDAASGSTFERMWLEMMIEHHEGAIEMAEIEVDEGEYADAVALAENIITAQRAEIDEMESLLAR